ncbi:MAG: hypothetical protein KatS3mg076_2853 [Candidatus Binatia bacterium]|nr:MAG: hypothetical protein KatS3mg076_2853 [Candidatus Binatia bacterium]
MPLVVRPDCPRCGARLVRKPGGRCPECGADVRRHVQEEREREERIERVVAVVATLLVLGVFLFAGGAGLVEGVLAYVAAGALVWWVAKRTFG